MVCFSGRPTGCSGLLQDVVNEVFGAILQIDIEMNQSRRFTRIFNLAINQSFERTIDRKRK